MSTGTLKVMSQTALTATTTTTLYTVPASTTSVMKEVLLCNTDTATRTVTMQIGTGTTVAFRFLSAVSLIPGETKIFTFSTIAAAASTITGGADAGSVVGCTISGVEIT